MLLFWERGYEGTSMADLTQVMGLSPSIIYEAFGDKPGGSHWLQPRRGPARDLMTAVRRQNEVAIRERLQQARKAGELPREIDVDDYTRYLSMLLAGLSIQAANGSTEAELKRTAQMALRHFGY